MGALPGASIIIPVYNGELFIGEAIDCVMRQSIQAAEIIVVDDASTDGTARVVREKSAGLPEGRLVYLRNERNMERSVSRNRGAEHAKGEYLFFLDYDDLWRDDYLERVLAEFAKGGTDIVYSFPRTFVDEHGAILRVSRKTIPADAHRVIFSSGVGYPSASAFRRASFPGYVDDCILREDWEIFLRAVLEGLTVRILDEDVVQIRAHGGRTSANPKFWRSTMIVFRGYRDRIPPSYRGRFLLHAADVSLKYGDLIGGWRLVLQALGAEPSLVSESRVLLDLVKRGFRLDKMVRLFGARRRLLDEDRFR